ncbi:MAG: hypothetical protein ACK5AL_00765 [Planctomycetota bacterium]|jgi:hypothetical protein
MSEYQYYEFLAIDRPLTTRQMGELRACSTRARISTTGFVNEYHWGDFKGDEDAWMERYFDAFLYVANWGTNILKLRLPVGALPAKAAKAYCRSDGASARVKGGNAILTFCSRNEEGNEEITGEGLLATLAPLRADLLNGDHRALYLAWLLGVQDGAVDDDQLEPPVPAGLAELTGPLAAFVEFLRIDECLVAAAAQHSAPIGKTKLAKSAVAKWVRGLPAKDKDQLLTRIVTEDAQAVALEMQRDMQVANSSRVPAAAVDRRSVGALRRAARDLGGSLP